MDNPFAKARSIHEQRQGMLGTESMMNNPFEGLMDTQDPGAIFEQPAPTTAGLSSAMAPERIMDETTLMDSFTQIGLDKSKLSFTPVGKMMLNQQLAQKFGTDYMSNQQVANLVYSFDDFMKKNPVTAAKQKNQQESSTKRILGFLG